MKPLNLSLFCPLALSLVMQLGHAQVSPAMGTTPAMTQKPNQSPLCDPGVIDGTFTFRDQPTGEQTVSLHFQNKSKNACRLSRAVGSSFAVDGHSMFVESCWLCDAAGKPSRDPDRQLGNEIQLESGGRAEIDLQWASVGESCQWADWVDFQFWWIPLPYDPRKITSYLFIPSGWPLHICSAVRSSGYRAEADSPSSEDATDEVLHVAVLQATIYSDERATLHAEVIGQKHSKTEPTGCASLYTVRREPSGATRLDPLLALGFVLVNSYTPEQIQEDKERTWPSWKKDFQRRCDVVGEQESANADIPAEDLATLTHIEWRSAAPAGENPIFLTAATHFSVLDVDTLAPNWGETVRGIRAGLSVDRTTFKTGERAPLHLRWENVDAEVPLVQGECGEPMPSIEIQDSQHHVLRTIPVGQGCRGHGWGPFAIEKGKAARTFRELTTASPPVPFGITPIPADLPGPGLYYLVSVWSPHVLDPLNPNSAALPYQPRLIRASCSRHTPPVSPSALRFRYSQRSCSALRSVPFLRALQESLSGGTCCCGPCAFLRWPEHSGELRKPSRSPALRRGLPAALPCRRTSSSSVTPSPPSGSSLRGHCLYGAPGASSRRSRLLPLRRKYLGKHVAGFIAPGFSAKFVVLRGCGKSQCDR